MSLMGVSCVLGKLTLEEHQRCMQSHDLPPCGIPATFLEVMTRVDRNRERVTFSASTIQGCHRQFTLKREHQWFIPVDNHYQITRGTLFHQGLAAEPPLPGTLGVVRELRMFAPIATKYGEKVFSGQVDEIVLKGMEYKDGESVLHVRITDWKTRTDIAHGLLQAEDKHERQINCYAWLVTQSLAKYLNECTKCEHVQLSPNVPELYPDRVVVDSIAVSYISMTKIRTFSSDVLLTARGKMIGKQDAGGKWHRVIPTEYEELELSPLSYYELSATEEYIKNGIERQVEGRETIAPPISDPDTARVMCSHCPVKRDCVELADRQGIDARLQRQYLKKEAEPDG